MFAGHTTKIEPCLEKIDELRGAVPWERKRPVAFFGGVPSGRRLRDRSGTLYGRARLYKYAADHPDLLDVSFAEIRDQEQYLKDLAPNKEPRYVDLCSANDSKYMIAIDGYLSGWMRPQMILYGDSVPIIIESMGKPYLLDSWVPWVHYVPVRHDQSDLLENIQWLQTHDAEAKKIALAGKALYEELYSFENMLDDAVSVFKRYAELQRYEPQSPGEYYRLTKDKFSANVVHDDRYDESLRKINDNE